ncbi:MAG TPA: matrixin family metalloprotease [Labilithrix sp.]|nr:matrixin family metalloprotease [Labilithrix sp.]
MRSSSTLVGLLATVALSLAPLTAHAFCRTTTVVPPPDFQPPTTGEGCFEQGLPLYHQSQCVPYHLLAQESAVLPRAVLSNALAKAFGAWTATNATCSPGISGIELAPVSDTRIVDYQTGQRGNNVFGVVQGAWTHPGGSDTLSLATLTFNADTGQIYDADLEIREDLPWSGAGTPGPDAYDLQAVLTHEVGHVLGLAHAQHKDAVMAPSYSPGSTSQRALSTDDAQGICAIYPDRQTRSTGTGVTASTPCDLSPGTGSSGGTCGDPVVTHGCGVGRAMPARQGTWLASLGAFAALGTLAWRARRRPRDRATALIP